VAILKQAIDAHITSCSRLSDREQCFQAGYLTTQTQHTYSWELRLRPSEVKSTPGANATRLASVSAARININKPIIPNWSETIPLGMFVTVPAEENVSGSHTNATSYQSVQE